MKSKEELKKVLHALIDSIEDEHILNVLNDEIVPYVIENRTKEKDDEGDDLTKEQEKELDEAIRQADAGETISWEEFKQSMARWHTNNNYKKI